MENNTLHNIDNLKNGTTSGLAMLWKNLWSLPHNLRSATIRHGQLKATRSRSQAVFANVFLHIQSVRVHRWSLKKSYTIGLGVASAVLFGILAVTGILLMVYYKPTVAEAYNSVKDIHYVVPGGKLLRNAHRWAGHLMIITVFLHMIRVFFTRSYQKPRDFNWLIGIGLLILTLILGYTGYCLPWDQLGYWAMVIGANIAGSPGELTDVLHITNYFDPGSFIRTIFLGSHSVGGETLLRFYWLHCIILPLSMCVLMAVHFWRIRKDGGLSRPVKIDPEELKGVPQDELAENSFQNESKTYSLMCLVPGKKKMNDYGPENTLMSWPHLFRAEMAVCMIVLAMVLLWGVCINAPLEGIANSAVPENPAKAPWYFLGLQELVSYSAFAGGLLIPTISMLALALIPFLDREEGISGRWSGGHSESKLILSSSIFALISTVAALVFVVNFGWLRNWIPHINQLWIILFNPGTVLFDLFFVYSVFVVQRTRSTRMGAIAVFCCFMVSFIVLTYFGTVHRGPNWDFFWWPTQWPTH